MQSMRCSTAYTVTDDAGRERMRINAATAYENDSGRRFSCSEILTALTNARPSWNVREFIAQGEAEIPGFCNGDGTTLRLIDDLLD